MSQVFYEKVADHAFESVKLVVSAFLALLAVYFATIAALFAFSFDPNAGKISEEAVLIVAAFSAIILTFGWASFYLIFWASGSYVRAMSKLSASHSPGRIKAARIRALGVGGAMAVVATVFGLGVIYLALN